MTVQLAALRWNLQRTLERKPGFKIFMNSTSISNICEFQLWPAMQAFIASAGYLL